MSENHPTTSELDPLKREVLEWIVLLTSGAATKADAAALKRWRAQSPAHDAAFVEMLRLRRSLHRAAAELRAERGGATDLMTLAPLGEAGSGRGGRRIAGGASAPWWYKR